MMSETTESVRSSKPRVVTPNGIPDMLSFDRIISDGTCPVSFFALKTEDGH